MANEKSPVDSAQHPVDKGEVRDGVEECDVRLPFQQQDDWIELGFGPEMSSQWNDKVVDAGRGEIGGQNDDFVGPVVLFGASVTAVFANLTDQTVTVQFIQLIREYLPESTADSTMISFPLAGNKE
jgi:hypothetical protein